MKKTFTILFISLFIFSCDGCNSQIELQCSEGLTEVDGVCTLVCEHGYFSNNEKCYEVECVCDGEYFIDEGIDGRFGNTETRIQKNIDINKNVGIFITYGQSNSCNSGEIGYSVINEVFQFYNDSTYLYEDPSLGGTKIYGSVWGMVGDKLIENEIYDQVVFSMTGYGGKTIGELSHGHYYEYFIVNYCQLLKKFGRVDGILFHQGESNRWSENQQYYNEFELFYNKIKNDGICSPFYLSLVSYCGDGVDLTLLNIQNDIIINFENILRGPNTDLLIKPQYRLSDNCHFSLLGYQHFSDMWVDCIINKSEL
jgi:hypothetical protein